MQAAQVGVRHRGRVPLAMTLSGGQQLRFAIEIALESAGVHATATGMAGISQGRE